MARFLLACYPIAGHRNPNIALGHALVAQGHDVAIYSGTLARPAIEQEGFAYFPYHPAMDERITNILLARDEASFIGGLTVSRERLQVLKQTNATMKFWFLSTVPQQVQDLQSVMAQWNPDVLVTDIGLFGPFLILKDLVSIPVAVFCVLIACPLPGPDAPTWGRGLPAPRNRRARLQSRVERVIQNLLLSEFRSDSNRLRADFGLPGLTETPTAYSGKTPLYMVGSAPELDYDRSDLPPSVEYVGPCLWHGSKQETVPDWLASLAERRRPVIHVTEGTIHLRKPLVLSAAAQGLGGMEADVVMTSGNQRSPDSLDLGPLADNIRLESYVSHGALFPHTDVVITTGGAGTVLTALTCGVPLVVVPTGWDLPESAQRVAECGAGIRIDPRDCTPETLRAAVQRLLDDPGYRNNARRVGDALLRQGGPHRAAELLEKLASDARSGPKAWPEATRSQGKAT